MEQSNTTNGIICSCCGKEISPEAKVCPHCGQPTAYKKNLDKTRFDFIYWLIAAIIICAIIG